MDFEGAPMKTRILAATVLASLLTHAWADVTTPTASQLEQEQRRIEAERKAMFDPNNPATKAKAPALPSSAAVQGEMKRIEAERKAMFDPNNPATKNAKNVFPNVPTPEVSNIDIQALAKRYEQRADARRTDDLMVFVSFTMPPESLKRIVAQVSQLGGTVVLNGFKDNSWKATAFAIKDLGEKRGNVVVNPNAFAKYKVKSVPVTVLTKPEAIDQLDSEGCALPDTYAAIAGDVSLDYALEEIAQHDRRFTELAQRYARQLRGR